RQPLRDAVSVLDGLPSGTARRPVRAVAPARAFLSAALAFGVRSEIPCRLRASRRAAARPHARGCRRTVAGSGRGALQRAAAREPRAMNRREFLGAAAVPLVQAIAVPRTGRSGPLAVGLDGQPLDGVKVIVDSTAPVSSPRVTNRRGEAVRVKEVIVLDRALSLPASTAMYGEGFQMLT